MWVKLDNRLKCFHDRDIEYINLSHVTMIGLEDGDGIFFIQYYIKDYNTVERFKLKSERDEKFKFVEDKLKYPCFIHDSNPCIKCGKVVELVNYD